MMRTANQWLEHLDELALHRWENEGGFAHAAVQQARDNPDVNYRSDRPTLNGWESF